RVQVLTNAGALDRDKQLAVVRQFTDLVAAAAGDASLADRTWVLLTEAVEGGWGLAGHANTNAELVGAARAQIAELQRATGSRRGVPRPIQDPSHIRPPHKNQATVDTAPPMPSASPSILSPPKSRQRLRRLAPRPLRGLPQSTPQPDASAKQFKSQGYRFVRP